MIKKKKIIKITKKEKLKQYTLHITESEAVSDHLAPFPEWINYSNNGLEVKLNFYKSSDMSEELHEWVFLLLKNNMKEILIQL